MDIRRSYAPPSVVKNIQHIIVSMAGAGSKSVTVASYNSAKSYINPVGVYGTTFSGVTMDNSTQITINLSSTSPGVAHVELVEFW